MFEEWGGWGTDVAYADAFESFDYSSGEGFAAYTDAMTVDYGLGADAFGDYSTGVDFGEIDAYDLSPPSTDNWYNSTPETQTSDYGAVSYAGEFGGAIADYAETGVRVASQVATATRQNSGAPSGGGVKQNAFESVLRNIFGPIKTATPPINGVGRSSTAAQNEARNVSTYSGQLGAGTGFNQKTLLLMGAVLLVGIVVYRTK